MQAQVTLYKVPGGHVMLSIVHHTGILQRRHIQSCKLRGCECFVTYVDLDWRNVLYVRNTRLSSISSIV